jgi:poly(3-hydroxybutyrate) depolymerase/streptogramin lyase
MVDRQVASSGCGSRKGVRTGGTAELSVAVPPRSAAGASERSYWLHVPPRYNPDRPTPLLVAFHGGGGTGPGMEQTSGLSVLADQQAFLVAYPQALRQGHGRYPPGWDTSGPTDPAAGGIDDGLYVSDMLTAIQAAYCVDPTRIWATGFSNGAGLVGYLACVLAGRIAAFAPVEAVFFQIPGGCHPAHPAAILDVHVRTDPVAPYAGVPARGSPDYYALSIPGWLRAWASRDGCSPRWLHTAGTGVDTTLWARCPGGVSVAGDVLPAGGHTWFADLGAAAGDSLITSYFAAHPFRRLQGSWKPLPVPAVVVPAARRVAVRSMREFRLPEPGAEPFDVAVGPDGSAWFTEFAADKIGRISRSGAITQFKVPTANSGPYQITEGPDGAMWFTEYNTTKIGRVSGSGRVTEYQIPGLSYGGAAIMASPSGEVFAADPAGFVDVISRAGPVTRLQVPSDLGLPFAIGRSRDGTLWLSELTGFYEFSRQLLAFRDGSGTPSLTVTLPDPLSDVVALAAGPGNSVWFADFGGSDVGEVGPAGQVSVFAASPEFGGVSDIAAGSGESMWFSEQDGIIGRVGSDGHVTELALPPDSNVTGIAAGRSKSVWVAEPGRDRLAEIVVR